LPEWTLQADSDLGWVREMPDVSVVELAGNWVRFTAPDAGAAEAVLRRALSLTTVSSFAPHRVALNRLFQAIPQSAAGSSRTGPGSPPAWAWSSNARSWSASSPRPS